MVATPPRLTKAPVREAELVRVAKIAAPLLQGIAGYGHGYQPVRNRPGSGLEFLDTRVYQPGDDWRSIDWRLSARSRELIVRRFRDESSVDWIVCLDRSASVAWGTQKWLTLQRLAAALAFSILHAGHRAGLLFWSDRIYDTCDLGRGARHFGAIQKMLVNHRPAGPGKRTGLRTSNLSACLPYLGRRTNAVVLSDFLIPDGLSTDLAALRARSATVHALQVIDPNETRRPSSGSALLRDSETAAIQRLDLSAARDDAAGRRLLSHNERLRRHCRRLDIRLTGCRTDESWARALLRHLETRA